MNASTNREYTSVSLKKTLIENHFDEYRNSLIAIAELNEYSRERVSDAFKNMLEILFTQHSLTGQTVLDRLPSSFMEETTINQQQKEEKNVFEDTIHGCRIQFDTIHGVKGETHDATLYLETEMKNPSDIVRILELEKQDLLRYLIIAGNWPM